MKFKFVNEGSRGEVDITFGGIKKLDKLVDDMIANHIKDFISAYIKKELGFGSLEFNGDLLL